MEWVDKLKQRPSIAHLLEAVQRFNGRLGVQFAAAITYFSVLSLVPVLMVAFAALGLTVTVFVPDLLDTIKEWISDSVSGQGSLGEQLQAVVDQAFGSWQAVGIIGLVSAAWSGAKWVQNIRSAVRAVMRPDFDMEPKKTNVVLQTLIDLGELFALFVLMAVTIAVSSAATTARDLVESTLRLDLVPFGDLLLSLVPVAASLVVGFVLFLFLFRVFPERPVPGHVLLKGALIGSVGLAALQYATGLLVRVFAGNAAAAVFGSVIVLMLFFNLLAMLIILVAAWIGTHPAFLPPDVALVEPAMRTPTDYATKKLAAVLDDDRERVPREVADRAASVSLGVGAAAGVLVAGVVAVAASVVGGLRARG